MILFPAQTLDDWQRGLADPERHWVPGYSAHALASCWHTAAGFPDEVRSAFDATEELRGIEPLLVLPEHKVPLPGGSRSSQTDVWVLARSDDGLVSIAVEGKVAEPFGPTLAEWLSNASTGKLERITFLRDLLRLDATDDSVLRYQLLHRAASALIEARRFHARAAVMLVHSFASDDRWLAGC